MHTVTRVRGSIGQGPNAGHVGNEGAEGNVECNSLNGKEVHVSHNQACTSVADRSGEKTARIPSGVNGSTAEDYTGRAFTKAADDGLDWPHPGSMI